MDYVQEAEKQAKLVWDKTWNMALMMHNVIQQWISASLKRMNIELDPQQTMLVTNAVLVVALTVLLTVIVSLFKCALGKSNNDKKKSKKLAKNSTNSSKDHASKDETSEKNRKKSGRNPSSTASKNPVDDKKAKNDEPVQSSAIYEPVKPAEGPSPTSRVGPLFSSGVSFFAVAREVPASNTEKNRAVMVVASSSPEVVRVFTRIDADDTKDPLNPVFFDLNCEDLRVVSAKRISPKTMSGVSIAPSGRFIAVAVDQPPAVCIFNMDDIWRQHEEYCRRVGLIPANPKNKRPPIIREKFEAYAKSTVVSPHGTVATIANVACVEDAASGSACVVSSAQDTSVVVMNERDGSIVARTKTNQNVNLALDASPDSKFVVFGTKMDDVNVWKWTPTASNSSGVLSKCMLVRGHKKAVSHVAFGGPEFPWLLATASIAERSLCMRRVSDVWNAGVEPDKLWQISLPRYGLSRDPVDGGNTCTLAGIAISPCGQFIAVTYVDRTEVLSIRDGSKVLCFPVVGGSGSMCSWIKNGTNKKNSLLAVQSSNVVALYDVPSLIQH